MSKSKRTTSLVAVIGVLALCVLAYMIMNRAGVGETKVEVTTEDPRLTVADYKYTDVSTLFYASGDLEYRFTYNENLGKWIYDAQPKLPIDLELPTYMASAISSIKADRYVGADRSSFKDYGLEDPMLRIGISYKDGSSYVYRIGNYNSTTGTYYFNVEGTDDVYMIASGLIPYFDYTILELIDAEELPALSTASFTLKSVTIDGEALPEDKLEAYKTGFAAISLGEPAGWATNASELSAYGLGESERSTLVIAYSEAQNVSGSENSISSTVHVEGTLTLYLGAEAGEGVRYCMTDKTCVMYTVSDAVSAVPGQ